MDLTHKTVVIIGATGGVGGALAVQAVAAGAVVYGVGRKPTCAAAGLAGYISADITTPQGLAAVAEKLPAQLDVVVVASGFLHNTDISPEKKLADLSAAALLKNYEVNALAPMLLARVLLPKFARDRAGVFAVLSARVGSISDNQLGGWYSYRMSKAALNMGLKTLSIEVARTHKQVAVLGLHPGTVDTDLSAPFSGHAPKLFTADESAAYLWQVMGTRGVADSGKVFDWNNEEVPA